MAKPVRKSSGGLPGARPISQGRDERSFVFYGQSGSGKTTLASTFPGPILLFDIRDEGTDSVADVKGMEVKEVESLEDFEEDYFWLVKNPKKYKTIVIDTVSQWQQLVTEELVGTTGRSGKPITEWGEMTQRQHGQVAAYMKRWIVDWRDLTKEGMNVVFLAQQRVFNGDEESRDSQIAPEVGPQLSPAIAKVLNASVSVIGSTFIRNRIERKEEKGKKKVIEHMEYCLRIGPDPVYTTKVRKPKSLKAPAFIRDASYEDILDIIKGEV